ncbi:hypothetical protein [Methanobrevibacter arboriphilus]|uniref:hypothetical protein n=1 Tax=Methanobrevibacter arboriphilus TaxID=39441 RepID=UPI0005B28262|nr:hypothetical protein [Methanobrevibacter arboriphilus]
MKTKLIIKECAVKNDKLHIDVKCDIEYDPDVFEPKLKITFLNEEDNLILPIVIRNRRYISFKNIDSLEFFQKFKINDLFLDNKWEKLNLIYLYIMGIKLLMTLHLN